MTDLEGRSLDEALARAMGWKRLGFDQMWKADVWEHDDEAGQTRTLLPWWHTSLDALLRDIEPVCRERGMTIWYLDGIHSWRKDAEKYRAMTEPDGENAYGPTAATALARAFLAVLTRGER